MRTVILLATPPKTQDKGNGRNGQKMTDSSEADPFLIRDDDW